MIADMQRLETAARLTMGDFEGPSRLPLVGQPVLHPLLKPALLFATAATAIVLIIALL